jgi:hypothetical protein
VVTERDITREIIRGRDAYWDCHSRIIVIIIRLLNAARVYSNAKQCYAMLAKECPSIAPKLQAMHILHIQGMSILNSA